MYIVGSEGLAGLGKVGAANMVDAIVVAISEEVVGWGVVGSMDVLFTEVVVNLADVVGR